MSLPAGTIIAYVGTEDSLSKLENDGWLLCNGRELTTGDYPALSQAIGTAFGSGDESFYIPDLQGVFLRGVDNGTGNDPDAASRTAQLISGAAGNGATGDAVGTWQADAYESHTHGFPDNVLLTLQSSDWTSVGGGSNYLGQAVTTNASGASTETRPKNVYVYYLIFTG